ncbi:hypothetical protein AOA14_15250 [Sphingopyxis terrae subsp. terrae NBRC 15098]|uniref:Uncharacterized protein n=1 Tax=Sphingopyxis terrae subsp. terrae NBRC 15098 TaxID=1219058 RepID=A0A142W355_9SPHN|nr:hypothetical protein AOA14_15250 [Sphingopyxis terrae subsp. terrae NBRC 15098]
METRRSETELTLRSNHRSAARRIEPGMTTALPDPKPHPGPEAAASVKRPAPCAGLFGWRKCDDAPRDERPRTRN